MKLLPFSLVFCLWLILPVLGSGSAGTARAAILFSSPDSTRNSVLIKAEVSKKSVYQGEPLTVSYLLYHSVPIIDPQQQYSVKFDDCFVEEFPVKEMQRKDKLNGVFYQVVLLKKYLIIPQNVGKVKLPAISQTFKMNAPPDPNDFFGTERVISTKVSSEPVMVEVKALPPVPDSLFYSGGVGAFKVTSNFTPDARHSNLLTFKLQISGKGNLKNLNFPTLELPAGIDIFNETSTGTHKIGKDNLEPEHTYSFQIMANYRGTYTLPAFKFSYFDPDQKKYVTYQAPVYKWLVNSGPEMPVAKSEVVPVEKAPALILKSSFNEPNHTVFIKVAFIFFGVSGLLYLLGFALYERKRRLAQHPEKFRARNAYKIAVKEIRKLKEDANLVSSDSFSSQLIYILKSYLAAKSYCTLNEINLDKVTIWLNSNGIPAGEQNQVIQFLNQQYALRFSGVNKPEPAREEQLQNLNRLLQTLETYLHAKAAA